MADRSLWDSVDKLKGVGSKRLEALHEIGIYTIFDLLTHYPFRYEDLTVKDVHLIADKQKVVLSGRVINEPSVHYFGHKRSRLIFHMEINQIVVSVVFFNQPYYAKQIKAGQDVQVLGVWDQKRAQLTGQRIIKKEQVGDDYEPIYPASKAIKATTLRQLIEQAYGMYHDLLEDVLPQTLQQKYHLFNFPEAIKAIHFPTDDQQMERAYYSLIFMELFIYQLKLISLNQAKKTDGQIIRFDNDRLKAFFSSLPFELTGDQKKAVNILCKDFLQKIQMYRLLQGDVGSGKTVVAAGGIFATYTAGIQSALMAPTEILAKQHYESLLRLYQPFDIQIALLTSSTTTKERTQILERLKTGDLDCLIGTHALLQEDVVFRNLAFVVIDEQHRFGVNQRRTLREKGQSPNVLFMTATPIPRTLAITAYGQMDVTMIKEMPPGRKPVKTYWIQPRQTADLKTVIFNHLNKKQQVYIISPLIEESEHFEADSAEDLRISYQKFLGPEVKIGLLHGRLSQEEKDQVMKDFEQGHVDVLVSTTVIEVGVDVPNATLMIIHGADHFGLAQLHQLRGRIGRGSSQSECYLVASPKTEDGKKRMTLMTQTTDGFVLSQADLEMRGPGDFFGSQQSGIPELKIADIIRDQEILEIARREAKLFLNTVDLRDNDDYQTLYHLVYDQMDQDSRILD